MKKYISVLLIFALISTVIIFADCISEFIKTETLSVIPAMSTAQTVPFSAPQTGDKGIVGIIIAVAVCGAIAFLTIKLTGDKNKIK